MRGARAGGQGDAIAGVVPTAVLEPEDLDEAAEMMTASARAGQRLAFVGGGTELGLGAAPEGLDVVLRTGALDGVVEHAPLDQIVTVECGTRFAALQDLLRGHGQMLALDPPWADRATVGGIVATSAFGALRTRYGSVRDLIIGVSFVRADGTRARAGGKVVKNVAGFDLPKLLTGSLGTLAFIATATFRLHPRPESSATVLFPDIGAADIRRIVAAARQAQLEPDAVVALDDHGGRTDGEGSADRNDDRSRDGQPWQVAVRVSGFAPAVERQRDRLAAIGQALGLRAEVLEPAGESRLWARHQAAREAPATFRAKVALLPTAFAPAVDRAGAAANAPSGADVFARLRAPLRQARAVFYPTLGLGFVAGDVDLDRPETLASAVARTRDLIAASGGSVVVHEAPALVRALVDVWGVSALPHSALPLMRNVKARLDPHRRLAPGRFFGGI
jgi:glycolate oxidase FAD binding subunit